MANAFRVAHSTAAAAQQHAQPGVFDILAQQSQSQSLKPALKYILKFVSLWIQNRKFSSTLRYFDELYAAFMFVIENHFLKKYGGSFTENFYSMKRIFNQRSTTVLSRAQRLKSLFFLVFVPYIESKLSAYREKIESVDPHMRTPFMNLYYKLYPIVTKLLGMIGLGFLVLYAFGYVNVQTLPLYLIGARLGKLTPEDVEALNSVPLHMKSGFAGRASRFAFQLPSWIGRLFSYALFFKDVHEFMQQNNQDDMKDTFNFNSQPVRSIHPLQMISENEVLKMDAGKCPICHKRRENDTVLSVSGYVFCFACINSYVRAERRCPVTKLPASHEQLVRLYRKTG
ncbi:hypothetical protein M3Y94_00949100 [Aphelenchoides besseyi]|nr:hypothetical protein M3Y94_00949100 [Aphelenchoides besseyi]KAI6224824.1 Peroxin-12 [Aphelenchoides besseyi]